MLKQNNFLNFTTVKDLRFFLEGNTYFDFYINLIDKAKTSVHLQTYIFDMDSFGDRVHAALIRASLRGVKVYLLIDALGSHNFKTADEDLLVLNKVVVSRFNRLNFKWFYQCGRRLHHKILVVDHAHAIIGGINVTTSGYGKVRTSQQLDFAVGFSGAAIFEIKQYCQSVFKKSYFKDILFDSGTVQNCVKNESDIKLKISINDWVYNRHQITKSYKFLTQAAQKEIIIVNSYFFPRIKFMKQLAAAAQRGVRVRLVLPTISDWPSYLLASQYLYTYFLKNGVEIYEWKKSVLHGKIATLDGRFTTIGSFNLNYTSYQQNLEMNVDISSPEFTKNVNAVIQEIINTGCEKVQEKSFMLKSSYRIRFMRFACYTILSVIAGLSVSMTRQENLLK
jgi:cardiolipin synthase A/B